ncbi:AAC(3) family N-acetyltransferase [Streptomyces sp. NPDC088762]|uniref:AAC(3) family N-acetyltransferase n=1 Tax=Streptomyces sp. NPDC088762 TaxID=3365891 RepID=UPI00380CE4A0
MVHASLSAFGSVQGGAQAVVNALRGCVGKSGTVVVPTFTPQISDRTRGCGPSRTAGPTRTASASLCSTTPFPPRWERSRTRCWRCPGGCAAGTRRPRSPRLVPAPRRSRGTSP